MDLPTCPSCGQSVLDEDVDECPFCGASMSGGAPTKKAASPSAAAKSKPSAKAPSRTKPAAPKKSAAAAPRAAAESTRQSAVDVSDDDPFAVDTSAAEKAIPLSAKPAKGRTFKVVCPMCEAVGYTSTKAAGRDVRCPNPDCLVPVFTAPEPPKPKPSDLSAEKPRSKFVPALAAGVLLMLVGVGVWYFGFYQGGAPPGGPQLDGSAGSDAASTDTDAARADEAGTDDGSDGTLTGAAGDSGEATPAEIRSLALAAMLDASRQRENNRSKPYCLRLTAEAHAIQNDLDSARAQLDQIDRLVPYYRILPLVQIAWRKLEAGETAAARQSLDEALTAAEELPTRGLARLEFAVELATALAATDRITAAQNLLDKHQETSVGGQLSAEVAIVRASGSFDLDAIANEAPILPPVAPQGIAVTHNLVARGYSAAALKWALAQPSPEMNSEAVVAWAEATNFQSASAGEANANGAFFNSAQIEAAAGGLPAAGRARLYARLADRAQSAGRTTASDALLSKAHDALAAAPPPAEFVLPDMKGLKDLQAPDPVPLRMGALAAAEIARAEARRGSSEEAWSACQLAMRYLRGSAPAPSAIRSRINEIADQGSSAIRDRLMRALELNGEDAARLAFNDYRKNCGRLDNAAQQRFSAQEAILAAAAEWGLRESVWNEIKSRAYDSELDRREPWLATRVPWVLLDGFEEAGDVEATEAVRAALRAAAATRPEGDALAMAAWKLIEDGRPKQAAREFETRKASLVPQGVRDRWRLRLACRLVARGRIDSAFEFSGAVSENDIVLREEALRMSAALATRRGHGPAIWKIGQKPTWSATEVVSIYRGLIEGFDAVRSEATAAAASPPPEANRAEQAARS